MSDLLNTGFKQSTPKDILVFGEVLFDLIKHNDAPKNADPSQVLGGAASNFSYRLKTLDSSRSLNVSLVSARGNDQLGQYIDLFLKDSIGTSAIQVNDKPTGTVNVTTYNDKGATYVINTDVAYDYIRFTSEVFDLSKQAKLIYFGSLAQRNEDGSGKTLRSILQVAPESTVKFVDINLRLGCYTDSSIKWSFDNANIFKLSHEEIPEVAKALGVDSTNPKMFAEKLADSGKIILLTLGEYGAIVAYKTQGRIESIYAAGYQIPKDQMIDTIGCGDSFSAEFVRQFMNGERLINCLISANEVGAAVALTVGGMSPVEREHFELVRSLNRNIHRDFQRNISP